MSSDPAPQDHPPLRARTHDPWAALSVGLFLFALLLGTELATSGRDRPTLGTDGLIYHLAIPALWRQEGLLAPLDLVFHDHAAEHAPMATQLAQAALMRVAGDDALSWLVQPTCLLLLALLALRSARLLGLGRALSFQLAAWLVLFPPFQHSAQLPNNELALTLGAALALYAALLARRRPRPALWLGALGLWLLLGVKTVGVIYAPVALLLLTPAARARWRAGARGEVLAATALAASGAWSFLLTAWRCGGNPLYPATVLGLPGLYDPRGFVTHGWSPSVLARMLWDHPHPWALRAPFALALWGGSLAGLWALRGQRAGGPAARCARRRLIPLAFVAGGVLIFFWRVPFWQEHRLLFPIYYALWPGLAAGLAQLSRGPRGRPGLRRLLPSLGLGLALALTIRFEVWQGAWMWLALALALPFAPWPRRWLQLAALSAAVVLPLSLALSLPELRARRIAAREEAYPRFYGPRGEGWLVVEALSAEGRVVAYAGSPLIYPLFGSLLQNRVVYARTSPVDRPTPIEVGSVSDVYIDLARARRRGADEAFWLAELERRGVQLLFLDGDRARGGVDFELGVARRHPERFKPRFARGGVYVFEVLSRAADAERSRGGGS
ncbi:MAG: hypothetical protein AB7N76_25685 [Planctomycetota bacterium]